MAILTHYFSIILNLHRKYYERLGAIISIIFILSGCGTLNRAKSNNDYYRVLMLMPKLSANL